MNVLVSAFIICRHVYTLYGLAVGGQGYVGLNVAFQWVF